MEVQIQATWQTVQSNNCSTSNSVSGSTPASEYNLTSATDPEARPWVFWFPLGPAHAEKKRSPFCCFHSHRVQQAQLKHLSHLDAPHLPGVHGEIFRGASLCTDKPPRKKLLGSSWNGRNDQQADTYCRCTIQYEAHPVSDCQDFILLPLNIAE